MENNSAGQSADNIGKPDDAGQASRHLQRIEELLEKQAEHNEKMLRASRSRTVFLVIFVIFFALLGISMYVSMQAMTQGLPELIDSTSTLVSQASVDLQEVVDHINSIDFQSMNEALQGIASIDYESLNVSINGLQQGVEAFQGFVDALSSPFNAVGSLFGS